MKKLRLKKESLRRLTQQELHAAVGAGETCSCVVCRLTECDCPQPTVAGACTAISVRVCPATNRGC